VTDGERRILQLALSDYDQVTEKKHMGALIDFFEHNELHEMPKIADIRQQLATIATNILVTKPEPFIKLLRNGLPALHVDTFWSQMTIDDLTHITDSQRPTGARVADVLTSAEDLRPEEANVFYYLRQFVLGLDGEDMQLFLQFVTGSVHMPRSHITVSFFGSSAVARHIVAHTCSNTIEISTAYSSFQEFKREMLLILHDQTCMEFSLQ